MTDLSDDLLRGAEEIATFMGVGRRQIYHLVQSGQLPVFKLGATLCARRSRIFDWIERQEAKALGAKD